MITTLTTQLPPNLPLLVHSFITTFTTGFKLCVKRQTVFCAISHVFTILKKVVKVVILSKNRVVTSVGITTQSVVIAREGI